MNKNQTESEKQKRNWRYTNWRRKKLIDKNLKNGITQDRIIFEVRWWSRYTS
ncbi:hypothetical protein HYD76_03975 [Mycoplasmopsis bovis]|nr:hypothetical protein [Mycoplasmopsis bovis]QQH48763.1 hypothetical protein HYD76_03975 [Mycoplasmopsis bovis]